MEDIIKLRNDMEESLTWRKQEYFTLKNTLKEENKIPVTKILIVILYAHLEGFFKDCLESYVSFLNSSEKTLASFSDEIITLSLTKEFSSFEDLNKKCKELKLNLPIESFLHKFHRRKELTIIFRTDYLNKKIKINEKVINTKSNLNYDIFQENFYLFGLDYNYFDSYKEFINKLVNLRNSVAHGSQKTPINFNDFQNIELKILELMEKIIVYLYNYCEKKNYLSKEINIFYR